MVRFSFASAGRLLDRAGPRRRLHAARLAACLVFVLLACNTAGIDPLLVQMWLANGAILAYLMLEPRRRWPFCLAAGYTVEVLCRLSFHQNPTLTVLFTALHIAAIPVVAQLLSKGAHTPLPRFTDRTYLFRFLLMAGVAAPFSKMILIGLLETFWPHLVPASPHLLPVISDGLGTCVSTPACAAIFRLRIRKADLHKPAIYLLAVAAVSLFAFKQDSIPPPILIYPLLVLVLLRLELAWGTVAAILATGIGSWYATQHLDSVAAAHPYGILRPAILLQLFLGAALIILYSISVVLERRRSVERRHEKIARQHALVTENSRDVIVISDFQGWRSYISAAAGRLSGWSHKETLQHNSIDIVHPEDRPRMIESIRLLREGALDATVECRVQKKDGTYGWIELVLCCIRDSKTGEPTGILSMGRDITVRKLTEKRLQEAYKIVEELAITDGLTGLANRRRFDQCLVEEWRRGMRDRRPLSLLIVDADRFKAYNDTYGHLRGDSCLKQIAESIQDVVSRPGDLVARFGGEEFAVILPATDNQGAMQIAEEICDALRSRRLKHAGNQPGIVTVSVGCVTMVPQLGRHATDLIEFADQALYKAKGCGRNQVYNALQPETWRQKEALASIVAKSA